MSMNRLENKARGKKKKKKTFGFGKINVTSLLVQDQKMSSHFPEGNNIKKILKGEKTDTE